MSDHVHDENGEHDHDHHTAEGIDLLRLRFVDGQLECTFDPDVFTEGPSTWGVVLAEVGRNLSTVLADHPEEQEKILREIRSNFLEALEATNQPQE